MMINSRDVRLCLRLLLLLLLGWFVDDDVVNLENHLDQLRSQQELLTLGDQRIKDVLLLHVYRELSGCGNPRRTTYHWCFGTCSQYPSESFQSPIAWL